MGREMENNLVASLYFSKDRILFAVIEKTETVFVLHYVNSIKASLDLYNLASEEAEDVILQLSSILEQYKLDISNCFITIDAESCITTKLPSNINSQSQDFIDLLNLEIRQNYPAKSIEYFRVKIIDMLTDHSNMNLAIIIDNSLISSIENFCSNLKMEVVDINVAQFSAINALLYNYPSELDVVHMIVNMNEDIAELSMVRGKQILSYDVFLLNNSDHRIADSMEQRLENTIEAHNINVLDGIYFFGQNLTKMQYLQCWELGMLVGKEARRLNPFRLLKTKLEQRDIDYCARALHIYPPCIGGALPIQYSVKVI